MTASNSQHDRWISTGLIVAVLCGCGYLLSQRLVDPDLWGHIQYGEDWMAEGALPRTASHTYADPAYPWINHENLSELTLALTHRALGGYGMMIAKCLLGMIVLLVMRRNSLRRGVSPFLATMCMVPVAMGLAEFWAARPQLSSFVCCTVLLALLESVDRRLANGLPKRLWLVIPVIVIWTNSHGGFLAGLCILLAWLGLRTVEGFFQKRSDAKQRLSTMSVVGMVALMSTLLNPYGFGLPMWLAQSLGTPRPEISEWVSVWQSPNNAFQFFILVIPAVWGWWLGKDKRDWVHAVIFALVAIQAFKHMRHIAFLSLLFGFYVPVLLESAFQRVRAGMSQTVEKQPLTTTGFRLVMLQIGGAVIVLGGILIGQLNQFGVKRDEYPVDAIQFMADHNINGRLVVTYDWAQYAIAALGPESAVGFDGRFRTCYSQQVVDMHFDLITGNLPRYRNRSAATGPFDGAAVLEFQSPALCLIDRQSDPHAVQVLETQSNWTLLYQDHLAQLWGRREIFDTEDSADFLPKTARQLSDRQHAGLAEWPAIPGRTGRMAFFERALDQLDFGGTRVVPAIARPL